MLHAGKQSATAGFAAPLEVVFNYLGRLQQLEREDSLFQHHGDIFNGKDFEAAGDMGRETPRFALLEISTLVVNDKLHVSFTYNRNMRREAQIQRWVSQCKQTLEEDIQDLKGVGPELTPSDYPLLPITSTGLESMVQDTFPRFGINSSDQVEDIYPCSPMQVGILLSQLRDPNSYMFHTVFEVKDPRARRVNTQQLRKAWQMTVDRHPIMRTIFVDSNYQGGSFDQLVLRKLDTNVFVVECDDSDVHDRLEAIKLREINDKRVPNHAHQLTICKTYTGRVLIKLELNHVIIDGGSVDILLRDFAMAYDHRLPEGHGPLYSDYIKFIRTKTQDEALSHWTRYMDSIQPSHLSFGKAKKTGGQLRPIKMAFDRFPELQQFCEKHSVTLANLTLSAWALVLRRFTGSSDICFGYPSAGRDAPIHRMQDAVGIFINMLCCRVKLAGDETLTDIAKRVQEDYIESLPYQSCSLAAIQHELGLQGQSLFNTTLSIQNHSKLEDVENDLLTFDLQKAYDPSEVRITPPTGMKLDVNGQSVRGNSQRRNCPGP